MGPPPPMPHAPTWPSCPPPTLHAHTPPPGPPTPPSPQRAHMPPPGPPASLQVLLSCEPCGLALCWDYVALPLLLCLDSISARRPRPGMHQAAYHSTATQGHGAATGGTALIAAAAAVADDDDDDDEGVPVAAIPTIPAICSDRVAEAALGGWLAAACCDCDVM